MKYPYKAFLLTASMNIKEVMVTGTAFYGVNWLTIEGSRSTYHKGRLFESKADAIHAGESQLETARARLATGSRNLAKKQAALAKIKDEQ